MNPKPLGACKICTCFEPFTSRMTNLEASTCGVRYSRAIPQCQRLHTVPLICEPFPGLEFTQAAGQMHRVPFSGKFNPFVNRYEV